VPEQNCQIPLVLAREIEAAGFSIKDCPYTPILPEYEGTNIVRAIRTAERKTGLSYTHSPR
jgi:hypothetical protein